MELVYKKVLDLEKKDGSIRVPLPQKLIIEPKVDGTYFCMGKSNGKLEIISRRSIRETRAEAGLAKIASKIPDGTVLLAEGEWVTQTATKIVEARGYPRVYVFDVFMPKMPILERKKFLHSIIPPQGLKDIYELRVLDYYQASPSDIITRFTKIEQDGYDGYHEGIVVKFPLNSSFSVETWLRKKRWLTVDYVCMGYEISDSKWDAVDWGGQKPTTIIKSVVGGLYENGVLVRKVKADGFNLDMRRELSINGNAYIGKAFEAKGQEMTDGGSLRFPKFVRWRDDKDPKECNAS